MTTLHSVGDTLLQLLNQVLLYVPKVISAAIILIIGYIIARILGYIPRVFVAFLIVVVGALIANVVAGAVRGATVEAGLTTSGLLATLARWFILLFTFLTAVTELDVAQNMIFILFASAVGMVALAGGLAFGLGGRETAAQMVNSWYLRSQQVAPRLSQRSAQR